MIRRFFLIGLVIFATHEEATGQWQFANGPYYSDIEDLIIDPQHPDTLFTATLWGKVYKTEDGGESWIQMDINPNSTRMRTLAMAPYDPHIVYAGGDHGIEKTEDGGKNWHHILSYDIRDLAIDPSNDSVVYAGTDGGVLKTSDEGLTWTSMNNGLPRDTVSGRYATVQAVAVDPANPAVIYAGAYLDFYLDGLYKSTNAGSSWVYVGFHNSYFYDIIFDPNDPNIIYVARHLGLNRSLDGGSSWHSLFYGTKSIAIDPTNSQKIYSGISSGAAIYLSMDGGNTWTNITNNLSYRATDVRAIAINPHNPDVVYIGTWIGVYKASDSSYSWIQRNEGFSRSVSLISVGESDSIVVIYAGGLAAGVHKKTSDDQTWYYTGLLGPISLMASPSHPDIVFAAEVDLFDQSHLYRTIDGGLNWEHTGLTTGVGGSIEAIAIDPFNSDLVYAGAGAGIAKSIDGGENWDIYGGFNDTRCISIAPQNTQILFAGTRRGIYKSTDAGMNWNFTGLAEKDVRTVATDPLDLQVVCAGVHSEGIFKSSDAGSTWFEINDGLTNIDVRSIIIHPQNNDRIYAGTKGGGVFQSLNGGLSWIEVNEGLNDLDIYGLAFDPTDPRRIYAATEGGVYIYIEPTSIEASPSQEVPSSFSLYQNYPNPFNTQTCIQYELPKDAQVSLRVYSILGQSVITLVKDYLHAGRYWIFWDGRNSNGIEVATGIYFIRFETGSYALTRKIVLLR